MVFPSLFPGRYAVPGIEESFLIQDPTPVASLTEERTLGVCGTRYGLISIHSHDQSVYGTRGQRTAVRLLSPYTK